MDELNDRKEIGAGETRSDRELHEIHEDFEDARRRQERATEELARFYAEFRDAVRHGKTWREPVGAA